MPSLKYDDVYSCLFSKIEAYDFIELPEDDLNDFLCSWLHSASSKPHVRKLFSTLSLQNDIKKLNYTMRYTVDEETDREFILEVLGLGMVVAWLEPKMNSVSNIAQMFGSKDGKWYSQANHLSELRALVKDAKTEQRRMIADRGSSWNTYLDGE